MPAVARLLESDAVVLHFEHDLSGGEVQPHVGAGRSRMARHVVQRFLQHAIHVDGDRPVHAPPQPVFS